MNILTGLIKYFGNDYSTFWTTVVAIFGAIMQTVSTMYKSHSNNDKGWKLEGKLENAYFYPILMVVGLLVGVIHGVSIVLMYDINNNFGILFGILTTILIVYFVRKSNCIKEKYFLFKKWKQILIYWPFFVTQIVYFANILIEKYWFIKVLLLMSLIVLECQGINSVKSYIKYEYSYADIETKSLGKFEKIEITNFRKKGKWLVIKEKKCEKVILFSDVLSINYHGEMKIIELD